VSARLWTWASNLGLTATLSSRGGTVDSDFPLAQLRDGDPAVACRCSTKKIEIVFQFASPVHVSACALIHHNLDAGGQIHLKGYADIDGAAGFDQAFTIGAIEGDGYRPDAWLDVDAVAPSASYQYWTVDARYADNSQNLAFGEIFLAGTPEDLPRWLRIGDEPAEEWPNQIEHLTDGGTSLRAEKGFRRTTIVGSMLVTAEELPAMRAWALKLRGRLKPLLLAPNRARPDVYLSLLDTLKWSRPSVEGGIYEIPLPFRQLSRGLVWP
jgi:hypothetical protein